ncbi:efflux RND transporter periplasmic adaptor subunit [Pseudomonadota bacterium]
MNRWFPAGAGASLALLLLWGVPGGAATSSPQAAGEGTPVKVITAFTSSEAPGFPGRVEAGDSALLAFRVGGELRQLKVQMGDRVQRGAVLAELDPTDYQLNLDARQAEFDLARLEAERASTLYAQKLISEDQYDTAQTQLATTRARLELAREELSFCRLTAPFTGAIAFTYVMPSEIVAPQQPVLNLQDISTLEIHFNLPPRYQRLLEGQEPAVFTATLELMPGVRLAARLKEVGMQPDPDTNSYPVTLLVDSPPNFSARPGMPVKVSLHHTSLAQTSWQVPAEALFGRSGDAASVWRIAPSSMTVHRTPVELDANGALRSGLNPGDQIVAAGVDRLREGQRVRPWVREGGL